MFNLSLFVTSNKKGNYLNGLDGIVYGFTIELITTNIRTNKQGIALLCV